jgi:hypothetical protein
MLACAGVLCTLHVLGGPLGGLFRTSSKERARRNAPPDVGDEGENRSMASAE